MNQKIVSPLLTLVLFLLLILALPTPSSAQVDLMLPEDGQQLRTPVRVPEDPGTIPTDDSDHEPPTDSDPGSTINNPTEDSCIYPIRLFEVDDDWHNRGDVVAGPASGLECIDRVLRTCGSNNRIVEGSDADECVWDHFDFENGPDDDSSEFQLWKSMFPREAAGGYRPDELEDISFMGSDCRPINRKGPSQVCGWLDIAYINSPISFIWTPGIRIEDRQSVVEFPLAPGRLGAAHQWHGSSDTPLLVFNPAHTGRITSAHQLFGTWTFGGKRTASLSGSAVQPRPWKDGYEALSSLDQNKDAVIQGAELAPLGLWFDKNQDGVSQDGEVQSLKELQVTKVFFKSDYRDSSSGNIHASLGFERTVEGRIIRGASVDWYGREYDSISEATMQSTAINFEESMDRIDSSIAKELKTSPLSGAWVWEADRKFGNATPTGLLILSQSTKSMHGTAYTEIPTKKNSHGVKSMIIARKVSGSTSLLDDGSMKLIFTVTGAGGKKSFTTAYLSADGSSLRGRTSSVLSTNRRTGASKSYEYTWTATQR